MDATGLRRFTPQAVGDGTGGLATCGGGAAAGMVAADPAACSAACSAAAATAAASIPLGATATTRAAQAAAATPTAHRHPDPDPRARLGAGACRRGVDSRGSARQQLGLGSCGERLLERVRRKTAGSGAGDAGSARRRSPRPPLRAAGCRRSWSAAGPAHTGCRARGAATTPRAGAPATGAPDGAPGASAPQRRGRADRWTVRGGAAGQVPGHLDRGRPSPSPRRMR